MKIRALIVHAGHIEENQVSGVPLWHNRGFDSIQEAVEHLGKAVERAFWQEKYQPGCCVATHNENPGATYCLSCGRHLSDLDGPDLEEISEIMLKFLEGTCDSIGSAWEIIEEGGWTFGPAAWQPLMREDLVVLIHTYGEWLLAHGCQGGLQTGEDEKQCESAILKDHIDVGFRSKVQPFNIYKADP